MNGYDILGFINIYIFVHFRRHSNLGPCREIAGATPGCAAYVLYLFAIIYVYSIICLRRSYLIRILSHYFQTSVRRVATILFPGNQKINNYCLYKVNSYIY